MLPMTPAKSGPRAVPPMAAPWSRLVAAHQRHIARQVRDGGGQVQAAGRCRQSRSTAQAQWSPSMNVRRRARPTTPPPTSWPRTKGAPSAGDQAGARRPGPGRRRGVPRRGAPASPQVSNVSLGRRATTGRRTPIPPLPRSSPGARWRDAGRDLASPPAASPHFGRAGSSPCRERRGGFRCRRGSVSWVRGVWVRRNRCIEAATVDRRRTARGPTRCEKPQGNCP